MNKGENHHRSPSEARKSDSKIIIVQRTCKEENDVLSTDEAREKSDSKRGESVEEVTHRSQGEAREILCLTPNELRKSSQS